VSRQASAPEEVVHEVEAALARLAQPSTLKGILIENPDIALTQVVSTPAVLEALGRLIALCENHARVEAPGRRGVKALLSGQPGTGKTMAARALAHTLRRPLYRVDLASVMSRWVGETEKNLREAMSAGEVTGAVLLFDEGDALFARRGEVQKGTDRYANMEVSYLLQAIEAYAGIAVVTTNQRGILDPAFDRRFDVFIDFAPPGRHERRLIWAQELGAAASALPPDTLTLVARRAELSGGNIASAARLARVLAYRRGSATVEPEDLRVAIQSELLKSGLPVQAAQWANELELKPAPPAGNS
jgi:SpoVK/Ycf46/Vps4 family AAA+-type ATPase